MTSTDGAGLAASSLAPSPDGKASHALDAELSLAAWRANTRQELLAPVDGIIELADMLLHDGRQRELAELLRDLEKIRAAGEHLHELIQGMLEPPTSAAQCKELERRVRHDIGNCLNPIIGYCEQWLEDAADTLPECLAADLEKLYTLGKQLAASLDKLVAASQTSSEQEMAVENLPEMYHGLGRGGEQRADIQGSILVVDDNDTNRDLVARWLRRDGHTLAEARDGREALKILRSEPLDLVLLDVIMPEMSGFQVLEQMKADAGLRHVPVIMLSAFTEIDSVVHCIERGAEDYLPKPFKPVLLRARVNACLEKKRLLEEIKRERERADQLLHIILPAPIVSELKKTNAVKPCRHDNVAVLFCDIAGFTPYCDHNEPEHFFPYLQALVEAWEERALWHGVEKIKTIGDAFMAAAGLLNREVGNPVQTCVAFGQEMIQLARQLTPWNIRVGIHAGPVVAGVIGRRQYLFDLWGDTVNTAARMESHGVVGSITLSTSAWQQIAHCARGERCQIQVKGKGAMEMVRFEGFLSCTPTSAAVSDAS